MSENSECIYCGETGGHHDVVCPMSSTIVRPTSETQMLAQHINEQDQDYVRLKLNSDAEIAQLKEDKANLEKYILYQSHALVDEIARLRDELDKYRWIPVEERLPEDEQNVLIFITEDGGEVQISDWEKDYEWGFMNNDIVTHWMPLPEPPKECE